MNLNLHPRNKIETVSDDAGLICGPVAISIVSGLRCDQSARLLDCVADGWRHVGGNHTGEVAEALYVLGFSISIIKRPKREDLAIRTVIDPDDCPHFVVTQNGYVRDGAYFQFESRPIRGCGLNFTAGMKQGYCSIVIDGIPDGIYDQYASIVDVNRNLGAFNIKTRDEEFTFCARGLCYTDTLTSGMSMVYDIDGCRVDGLVSKRQPPTTSTVVANSHPPVV